MESILVVGRQLRAAGSAVFSFAQSELSHPQGCSTQGFRLADAMLPPSLLV